MVSIWMLWFSVFEMQLLISTSVNRHLALVLVTKVCFLPLDIYVLWGLHFQLAACELAGLDIRVGLVAVSAAGTGF